METTDKPFPFGPPLPLTTDDVEACVRTLETILAHRTLLSDVPQSLRKSLLMAAGRVSRPDRNELSKVGRSHRRQERRRSRERDRKALANTVIREARTAAVYVPPTETVLLPAEASVKRKLEKPRNCYVCKGEFDHLHFFYDTMCGPCGDLNYKKRFLKADLTGRVGLVTGARVKIGYQAALLLLKNGARAIVTTRFPHDAVARFAREPDYEQWKDRLEVHGLDLRHSPSVELFCEYMLQTHTHLDVLINNAAQTVRRPPGFYKHLLEDESKTLAELPASWAGPLAAHHSMKTRALPASLRQEEDAWVADLAAKGGAIGILAPALLSQVPSAAADGPEGMEAFPEGKRDVDLQQVDLRSTNSWRMKLADVPTPELLEVQLVNSIAPFILCSKLKPLMMRNPTNDRHIVNVSAMEGKFTRYTKTDKHPHTNMAKAALNMMTLTSAPDYAADGIFMNAVDTGWVTDEDPALLSARKQREHDFQPPLDIVDGAARVVDPFITGLLTGEHVWGKFLKDYAPTTW